MAKASKPKIGVILSGCGVLDGSEIQEAVLLLLCLDQQGAAYQCFAPNVLVHPVNHITKKPEAAGLRSSLTEAARIARGEILDLGKAQPTDFDAFIMPGGFGVAKNLSDFASAGAECRVNADLDRLLKGAARLGKPLGFACIAPVIAAKVFGEGARLTIGRDADTAQKIKAMGANHVQCAVQDVIIDEDKRLVSTPAYMEAKSIKDVYAGLQQLVENVLRLVAKPKAP